MPMRGGVAGFAPADLVIGGDAAEADHAGAERAQQRDEVAAIAVAGDLREAADLEGQPEEPVRHGRARFASVDIDRHRDSQRRAPGGRAGSARSARTRGQHGDEHERERSEDDVWTGAHGVQRLAHGWIMSTRAPATARLRSPEALAPISAGICAIGSGMQTRESSAPPQSVRSCSQSTINGPAVAGVTGGRARAV